MPSFVTPVSVRDRPRLFGSTFGLSAAFCIFYFGALAQGTDGGVPGPNGHCVERPGSAPVFACWNRHAGENMVENLDSYAEFLPNLTGWDYRINLPHVTFQQLRRGAGGPVTMVGVMEDGRGMDLPPALLDGSPEHGHRSNTLWMLREEGGRIVAGELPSRRVPYSPNVVNTPDPQASWGAVGGSTSAAFRAQRVAAAATQYAPNGFAPALHIVGVSRNGQLFHSRLPINQAPTASWSPWQAVGEAALASPVIAKISVPGAGGTAYDTIALGWVDPSRTLRLRILDPGQSSWGPAVTVATNVDAYTPRLVWDGRFIHAVFSVQDRLSHSFSFARQPAFSEPVAVSPSLSLHSGQFDAKWFNGALHVVQRTRTGTPADSGVFYAQMTSEPGMHSEWTAASDTGLKADDRPCLGTLEENLFVIAGYQGRLRYARKDSNALDNRITGSAQADRWLEAGLEVDTVTPGRFGDPELLSFNLDLYLTTRSNPNQPDGGAHISNFGRAAIKRLVTEKWRNSLTIGQVGGNLLTGFGGPSQVRMIGDFDGDRRDEPIRFTQTSIPEQGPAPVFVNGQLWHDGFSRRGEIPLVGNFDGDPQGRDDMVTFTQRRLTNPSGETIATAPVYVALSDGKAFGTARMWHTFFSLSGEVPLVGDFNGDGRDDIATFVKKPYRDANGTVTAQSPVWVALSEGTRFGPSRIWHNVFSPGDETPVVGDFDGDGDDDIATFVRKPHRDANGNVIANAPVWVALSDRNRFGPSSIWHKVFAPGDELPRVADVDMDGNDDIVTFVRETVSGARSRNVYVAHSTGSGFGNSSLLLSDAVSSNDIPFFGSRSGLSLRSYTGLPADAARALPDLFVFEPDGDVRIAYALDNFPYATGAPWERYKWFAQKGAGLAMIPEWIYSTGPNHCLGADGTFTLVGAGGGSDGTHTALSVRIGSRAEHVMEEFLHTLFAHCLRPDADPFGLYKLIYQTSMETGGLDADNLPGCARPFDDCRGPDETPPEHFFLQLIKNYRLRGDEFRSLINEHADMQVRVRRFRQYMWIKQHWYQGAEFKKGLSADPAVQYTYGLLCLPGECAVTDPRIFADHRRSAPGALIEQHASMLATL